MTFTFRPLRLPADRDTLCDLLQQGFPELEESADLLAQSVVWKFRESARLGLSTLALDEGRAVGFYGVVPLTYKINGARRTVGLVVDVMSHPDVRRRGLFVTTGMAAMASLSETPIELVTGYPIRPDVMPGHMKVGWTAGFELPVYVLPTGRRTATPDSPWWLTAVALPARAYQAIAVRRRSRPPGVISLVNPAEFARNQVVARLCSSERQSGNRIERTESFWDWRLSRPGVDYKCLLAESPDGAAVAVARVSVLRGVPSLAVLDIEWDSESARTLAIRSLLDLAIELELSAVAMCANPTFARALGLRRSGFVAMPTKFTLIYRSTSSVEFGDSLSNEAEWRLSWLDSDTL